MPTLNQIKMELNQKYDTNIFRIAFLADSIWSPSGSQVENNGSNPPFKLNNSYFIRQIFDYLNYNKPVFRNINHSQWVHAGGSEVSAAYPDTNTYDKIRLLNNDNDESIIQIIGYSTIVFWFEGGEIGKAIDTGIAQIAISTNSIDYILPSETSLLGKKQVGRINDNLGYDAIINEKATNLTFPSVPTRSISNNSYISYPEFQYNNLNPLQTYWFKIKKKPGTNSVRLGGCYYFTGKTCLVQNFSIPGAGTDAIKGCLHNTIGQNNVNLIILQSQMYHDFYSQSEVYNRYYDLISNIKKYVTRIVLCACTPGGVVVTDSETELGDEEPQYVKGQNFVKEFNNRYGFNITKPNYVDYPTRGSVYQITIDEQTYNLTCIIAKTSSLNYDSWTYNNKLGLVFYGNFPIDNINYPATLIKISGDGANSFTLNSRYYFPPSMNICRDIFSDIAKRMGLKFIDLYQLFADIAIANGETIETDGYPVTPSSPLYSQYPDGIENYLSRYFKPNHWRDMANNPVFEKMKIEIFNGFTFD